MSRDEHAGLIAIGIVLLAWLLLHVGLIQRMADSAVGLLVTIIHRCVGHA